MSGFTPGAETRYRYLKSIGTDNRENANQGSPRNEAYCCRASASLKLEAMSVVGVENA